MLKVTAKKKTEEKKQVKTMDHYLFLVLLVSYVQQI